MNAHTPTKLARNQFRCFQCKKAFLQRDGEWYDWNHMQVHLCRSCDKLTLKSPERGQKPQKTY